MSRGPASDGIDVALVVLQSPYREVTDPVVDYVRRIRALYTGMEGPGAPWVINQTPQQIYRQVAKDGSVTYTNVPPLPAPTLRRGF